MIDDQTTATSLAPPVGASKHQRGSRIVLLQTQAENAGAQEISRILARSLSSKGHRVSQVFFFRRTEGFDSEPGTFFCSDRRPANPIALLRLLVRLYRTLRRLEPEVVITFQHFGNLIGAPIARLAGVRKVIGNQNTAASMMPGWVQWIDQALGVSGIVERVVVNSRETEAEYDDHPESYRRRLVRIDHGFEPKTSQLSKIEARVLFGLPLDRPILGCAARIHAQKHLDAAIKMLALEPSWQLALAGQGPARQELQALARSLGCADRVHWLGELAFSEIGDFLAALDVFVFPSIAETFGLAVVEAAAAGLPVIANSLPILREVLTIDGNACALFVDVDDSGAFAAAVRMVLRNGQLARTLTERGRSLGERYPADAMVESYEALIRDKAASPVIGK